MRPIRIDLEAFGSFARPLTVDFNELAGRNFFLVHGPTGAGKTTILDAICFALYGITSGEERRPPDMRSHHADTDAQPRVTLDFALGRDLYRVTRSPEWLKPKKKGPGETKVPTKAVLWQRTGLVDPEAEGTVLADKPSQVNQEIIRRLGFEGSQFRQVIILPQGRFQRFLMANSKEREEILEALFKTEVYRRIEEELDRVAKETATAMREARSNRERLLAQANAANEEELAATLRDNEQQVLAAQTRVARLKGEERAASAALLQAKLEMEKIRERDEATRALEVLEKQAPEYEAKKNMLKRARDAGPVLAVEAVLEQRKKESDEANRRRKEADKKLTLAQGEREKADQRLKLEEDRKPERDRLASDLAKCEQLRPMVKKLAGLREEVVETISQVGKCTVDLEKARKTWTGKTGLLEETKRNREGLLGLSAELESLELKRRAAADRLNRLKKLKDLEKRSAKMSLDVDRSSQKSEALEKELVEKRRAREQALSLWRQNAAASLARGLADGDPCPVCGSIDHPRPAAGTESIPDESELKDGQSVLEMLEKQHRDAVKDENDARGRFSTLEGEITTLRELLGDGPLRDEADLEAELKTVARQVADAKNAGERVHKLDRDIQKLAAEEAEAKTLAETLERRLNGSEKTLEARKAVLEEVENSVPEEYRDPERLELMCTRTAKQLDDLKEALEKARKQAEDKGRMLAAAEEAARGAVRSEEDARDKVDTQERNFQSEVTRAGFENERDYRSAKMEPSKIQALEQQIEAFDSKLQSARDWNQRAQAAAKGLTRPDLPALETAAEKAKTAHEKELQEETRLRETVSLMLKQIKELEEIRRDFESREAQYGLIGQLADTAKGRNPYNLTFQRFVLGALLDDVLLAASTRLQIMSSGRYQLERALEGRDRRTAWGLDLQVFDAYTGLPRSVSTLSGGEGFLASLALALGLADVVQAHAGGVHMETIFVDEGFGSLDPEALDLALRALVDLQEGGRLVGIVSHVPELKERIDARLEVTRTRTGSMARFRVS